MTEIVTSGPHEGRPHHPKYGAPLSGRARTLGAGLVFCVPGEVFRPYRIGIANNVWISDDFRVTLASGTRNWKSDSPVSYTVSVDGEGLGQRFRYERTAVAAALKKRAEIDRANREAAAAMRGTA